MRLIQGQLQLRSLAEHVPQAMALVNATHMWYGSPDVEQFVAACSGAGNAVKVAVDEADIAHAVFFLTPPTYAGVCMMHAPALPALTSRFKTQQRLLAEYLDFAFGLGCSKIVVELPQFYTLRRRLVELQGFKHEGTFAEEAYRQGVPHDVYRYGLLRLDYERRAETA